MSNNGVQLSTVACLEVNHGIHEECTTKGSSPGEAGGSVQAVDWLC